MTASQIIWLTGATSGIGRGLALALLSRGHRLALTSRRESAIIEVIDGLADEVHDRTLALPADVTDGNELKSAYQRLKDHWGVPDRVIANAGTHKHTELDDITYEGSRPIIELNLMGAIHTLTLPLPDMVARGHGTLVGVSSLAGYRGLPAAAAYGASKAGLINFLESLRFDAEGKGVQVQIINPGFVKTPLTDKNPFQMPMRVTVDEAVEAILRGMDRDQREIHFPKKFSWIMKTLRVLPYPIYHRLVGRITGGNKP